MNNQTAQLLEQHFDTLLPLMNKWSCFVGSLAFSIVSKATAGKAEE